MSLLYKLFHKSKRKHAKVVTLGTSGAGKTTLLQYLKTGEAVDETSVTLGINIRNKGVQIGNWDLSTIDVGGQELYKNALWGLAVTQAEGIIYVIDGTIKNNRDQLAFEKSKLSFEYMLNILNRNKPILVLINKQDIKELQPYSVEEAIQMYNVSDDLRDRPFYVIPGSAKFGNGIVEGMTWLLNKIDELM